jgi:hypothetical protein
MNSNVYLLLSGLLFNLAFLSCLFVLITLLNRGVDGVNYLFNALCLNVNDHAIDFLSSVRIDIRHHE